MSNDKINMRCYARWFHDGEKEVSFRDQTILQFGDSWNLIASFILLNPGSAIPKDNSAKNEIIRPSAPLF